VGTLGSGDRRHGTVRRLHRTQLGDVRRAVHARGRVGWRLAREHWGHGYATEGARAALAFGFDALALDEIVSFTTHGNARSRRVMERLGMRHDPVDDFDNPNIADDDELRPHVLYRLDRATWLRNAAQAER
jgi:RimJ/RimL family protein N-acetyltransferase